MPFRLALVFALVACACARPAVSSAPKPAEWVSPLGRNHPLVGRIWDVAGKKFSSESELFTALGSATYVGLGEQHDNADHHLFQARTIAAVAARGRTPGVVFEMLDREDEPAVGRALAATPHDPDVISKAVDWAHSGWPPWRLYRPVFLAAVTKELTLFAGGVDRKAAMRLAMEGPSAAPPELVRDFGLDVPLPKTTEDPLRREMRDAHCGLLPDSMLGGMVFVQRVRDAELADGLLRAGAHRGALLIAGNGHVRRDRGVPAVLAHRIGGASVMALGQLEVQEDRSRPADYASEFGVAELPFDYVLFTPRASDEDHCAEIRKKHGAAGGS